ncbi:minichromosome maintenance protein 5 [Conglomerata obtusa]
MQTLDLLSDAPLQNHTALFLIFIDSFTLNDKFYYSSLLTRSILTHTFSLHISLTHLFSFSPVLHDALLLNPSLISAFESALQAKNNVPISLHFTANLSITPFRHITSSLLHKIIKLRGIAISTSLVSIRPSKLFLTCKRCLLTKQVVTFMPRSCENNCGIDPFYVDTEKSEVYDEQFVKVQEMFEDVDVGEMPRHLTLVLEKSMVDSIVPGEGVVITGLVQMRNKLMVKILGIEKERKRGGCYFSDEEKEKFREFSELHNMKDVNNNEIKKESNNKNKIESNNEIKIESNNEFKKDISNKNSINNESNTNTINTNNNKYTISAKDVLVKFFAPQIHGHEDIKKAILCMLFGGTRRNKHGVSLRGDINVMLLGDPGTAKSQLLKFTNTISPGVYTSGKGSSAAGLTASVIRNRRGEFYLEGGALVLSDNGVCCIDEFDKMDVHDRVAIHEAMEQQTISINKAGINTVLNTRCSILAAANPIFGRYDDYKSVGENIDFSSTIMSRFDCIFVVQDQSDSLKDIKLAKHILEVHRHKEKDDSFIDDESIFEETFDKNKRNINNVSSKINDNYSDNSGINNSNISNVNNVNNSNSNINNVNNVNNKNNSNNNILSSNSLFVNLGLNKIFKSPLDFLTKYIIYARSTIKPSLDKNSQKKLTNFYVETRKKVKEITSLRKIPITVRQLESLIRISESLAKMELRETVCDEDVVEAIRLFTVSTINAVNKGHSIEGSRDSIKEIVYASERIKKVIPVGIGMSYEKIKGEVQDLEEDIYGKAIEYLQKNGKIQMRDNGRIIIRLS